MVPKKAPNRQNTVLGYKKGSKIENFLDNFFLTTFLIFSRFWIFYITSESIQTAKVPDRQGDPRVKTEKIFRDFRPKSA